MRVAVGVDVAKEFGWVEIKIAETGQVLASRRVDNNPESLAEFIDQVQAAQCEHGPATVALDMLGGVATLLEVMLHAAGLTVVHVPGIAVHRARRGTTGGERKSDPKDAKVIADQVRMREDLRVVKPSRQIDAELRLLVGRRSDLVVDQTRRLIRLRDLLASIHPGLEHVVNPTTKIGMWLLARYVTPAEIRAAGRARVVRYLARAGRVPADTIESLADSAIRAAKAQPAAVPGEAVAADIVRDLATEALTTREAIKRVDAQIATVLQHHPDAALVQNLPGMGATLTAEFLAEAGSPDRFPTPDQLASAAGLAPVLKQSGKVRYLQRATAGNKALKRVFYQSAFVAISCDPASRAYYARKRAEGKRHHQALIALARRRINVLHAILRTRKPYQTRHTPTAAA